MEAVPCPYWGLADHSYCMYCNPKLETIMTKVLPKSDVTASASKAGTTVVVRASASRDGKSRNWQGSGKDAGEAVKELVENILNDPISGEFMP